jgi:hypothetical protein
MLRRAHGPANVRADSKNKAHDNGYRQSPREAYATQADKFLIKHKWISSRRFEQWHYYTKKVSRRNLYKRQKEIFCVQSSEQKILHASIEQ